MANESKKGKCTKCGIWFWTDKHHILPRVTFGGKGDVVRLSPNCHRDYHEHLGTENLKNPDAQFHYEFFAKWLAGLLALVLGFLLYWG